MVVKSCLLSVYLCEVRPRCFVAQLGHADHLGVVLDREAENVPVMCLKEILIDVQLVVTLLD